MAGSRDLVLGIGCDRNTPYATLAQVIDEALAQLEASWADVRAVASIDLKADEVAMQELQRQRGYDIHFYPATWLAQVPVPNPSETVRKYTGTPSVSEAAALLVAGADGQPAPRCWVRGMLRSRLPMPYRTMRRQGSLSRRPTHPRRRPYRFHSVPFPCRCPPRCLRC